METQKPIIEIGPQVISRSFYDIKVSIDGREEWVTDIYCEPLDRAIAEAILIIFDTVNPRPESVKYLKHKRFALDKEKNAWVECPR